MPKFAISRIWRVKSRSIWKTRCISADGEETTIRRAERYCAVLFSSSDPHEIDPRGEFLEITPPDIWSREIAIRIIQVAPSNTCKWRNNGTPNSKTGISFADMLKFSISIKSANRFELYGVISFFNDELSARMVRASTFAKEDHNGIEKIKEARVLQIPPLRSNPLIPRRV